MNSAWCAITVCLKLTNVENIYLLRVMAPPYIRKTVASQQNKLKQKIDPRYSLLKCVVANKRSKSRQSFLQCVNALSTSQPATFNVAGTPRRKTKQVSHRPTGSISLWLQRDVAFLDLFKPPEICGGSLQNQSGQVGLWKRCKNKRWTHLIFVSCYQQHA